MRKEEVIDQLEDLKRYCEISADEEFPEDAFHKDIAALTIAINILKSL